jgi:hypothetical protein
MLRHGGGNRPPRFTDALLMATAHSTLTQTPALSDIRSRPECALKGVPMRRLLLVTILIGFCAAGTAAAAEWKVPGHFATIQDAVDSPKVKAGDTIIVRPGKHAGALLTKSLEIRGQGAAVINTGRLHPQSGKTEGFRLMPGSDGSTISNLTFEVGLGVISGEAVNNVTVVQNRFFNAYQAITNWGGSGWDISHNEIVDLETACGGGIGILIGDWQFIPSGVVDNLVAHNKVSGVLHVAPEDCGDYSGAGIVIYADFRNVGEGAVALAYNRVIKNKVSVVSDNPLLVDINAFEMTDTRHEVGVIHDNAIGFNDFRGTANQTALSPGLGEANLISRNFGENRGHGLHPGVFRPER